MYIWWCRKTFGRAVYILFVLFFHRSSIFYLLDAIYLKNTQVRLTRISENPPKDRAWIWYYFVCFNVLLKAILAKGCNKTIFLFLKSGMQVDIRITLLMFDTVDTPYKNTSGTEKYIPI